MKSHKISLSREIKIEFPFEPYHTQIEFMKLMSLETILKGNNALLESPTGTGKTLCMIAAAIASVNYLRAT
jgi:regulator of telomere elongation helicase 1